MKVETALSSFRFFLNDKRGKNEVECDSPEAWPVHGGAAVAGSPGASAPPPAVDVYTPVSQSPQPLVKYQKGGCKSSSKLIQILIKVDKTNLSVSCPVDSLLPARGRPSSFPPRPSCAPPLLCGVVPSLRCASSPPARAGAAHAPAASSSRAHVVVAGGVKKRKKLLVVLVLIFVKSYETLTSCFLISAELESA